MREVIAYIHTHWDREWYRTFESFRFRLIEVFDRVLELLETDELPCFYFDGQTAAIEDYLQIRPEKYGQIKSFVKSKRLHTGPFYCASDSLLAPAASLKKNLETGMKFAEKLGETDFIAYISDSFGHSGQMPELLKQYSIDKACVWRGLPDLSADLDWDGIKTVNLVQGYFQDILHKNIPIEQKAQALKQYLDKIAAKSGNAVLLPIGADHLAAPENIIKTINELNNIYTDYRIIIGSLFDYFKKITKYEKITGGFLDNSRTFLLKGVYSARPDIKKASAESIRLLTMTAEPLNKFAADNFGIKNYQSEIDYAYKELIKNHAHDSIYGCVIDEAAEDIMRRYNAVNTISENIIKRIKYELENRCRQMEKKEESYAPAVINLSKYSYSGKIIFETEKQKLPEYLNAVKISSRRGFTDKKLFNIYDIPVTEDITDINTFMIDVKNLPAGALTYAAQDKICRETFIKADETSIENKYIRLEISNGAVNAIDKLTGETYADFIKITDRKDFGDSYNFGAVKEDTPVNAVIKSCILKEKNHIRAVMRAVYQLNKDKINIDFILYNQSRLAEIETCWRNKRFNHLLQIGFNLKEKITKTLSEDLFSASEHEFDPDYDIYKYIPAPKGIELKTNTAAMQRFANAQNLTLITKGINEYEVSKNTLYLTLLRASGIISNPHNPARGTPAGPPLKTPAMQQKGLNAAHFAFAFTKDEKLMYELTEEFYKTYVCLSA